MSRNSFLRISNHRRATVMWGESLGSGTIPGFYSSTVLCICLRAHFVQSACVIILSIRLSLNLLSQHRRGDLNTEGFVRERNLIVFISQDRFQETKGQGIEMFYEKQKPSRVNIFFRCCCCHLRSPWLPVIESHTHCSLTRGIFWLLRSRGI